MAIQDDFSIDYANRRITYTGGVTNNLPNSLYTVNALYSWLQDVFDEPAQMDDPIPMSAQTPTQYTLLYPWFMDNESMKALYGGSLQTSGWAKSGSDGITALRWANAPTDAPVSGDIGVTLTGGSATGVLLAVDSTRQVAWVRNTSAAQFAGNQSVTGISVDFVTETTNGFQSGNNIWTNLFSVGTLQPNTEVYIGQEDDQLGGRAYHTADTLGRRIEKLVSWWNTDVDYTASPNNIGGLGHVDLLVLTTEMGTAIDGGRLAVFARQFGKVYSHFEFTGGAGNFVVPFTSVGADLNSTQGAYNVGFKSLVNGPLAIGNVIEDTSGNLRCVITGGGDLVSAAGDIDFYLIGDNEADGTLKQLADEEALRVRSAPSTTFTIETLTTALSDLTPADASTLGVTITFANTQVDVDESGTPEDYACTINCNNQPLTSVYKHVQFLTSRGNQDGIDLSGTPSTLLPTHVSGTDEGSEFYRAVGDVTFLFDGGIGTQISEGDSVINNGSTATGVVVSVDSGTSGRCVLTQVKGTFADDEQIARAGEHATDRIVVNGTVSSVVDNTGAPFGTFAGGRWFVAQGVVLTNVAAADANNWETISLANNTTTPPTVRTITFQGLAANDRAAIFEVATNGGIDIVKTGVGLGAGSIADTTITLDATVALDVPPSGWIRVVDTSVPGDEYRYEYSSVSGTTVTLRTVSPGDDVADAGGSTTVLKDTGVGANFGTDGNAKVGHVIRNVTDSAWAVVLRATDNDTLVTTPLSGGASWDASDAYVINDVVATIDAADTAYFPYIDGTVVSPSTSLSKAVKFVESTELLARARFSDAGVGGTRILPFELKGITFTDANLTVTAIRNVDTIAT